MNTAIVGDLEVVEAGARSGVVAATPDAGLAEIVTQIGHLDGSFDLVSVYLGPRDLTDGFDESYVHARLVELGDLLLVQQPDAAVIIVGIPPVAGREALRVQCNAAARVTADLRGFTYRPPSTL